MVAIKIVTFQRIGASPSSRARSKRGSSTASGHGQGKSSSRAEGVPHEDRDTTSSQDQGQGKAQADKRKSKLLQIPKAAVSISVGDTKFQEPSDEFCPLRLPGPYLPEMNEVSALSLFELFFNDTILDQIVHGTYAYAEAKKESKKSRYKLFMKKKFDNTQLMAFFWGH